jgi:hypothetical protein
MKRIAVFAAILALAVSAAASAQERTVDRSLAIDAGGRLSLESDRGTVNLTSWDQPTVQVHATIEPPQGASADYGRRAVDAVEIIVSGGGRAVTVRADYSKVPSTIGFLYIERSLPRVHFEVKAPRRLDLDLNIDRSDVVLQGFEGRLDLVLDRSSLDADDLGGALALRVDRGPNIDVSGLRGTLDLNLDRTEAALHDVQLNGDSRVRLDRGSVDVTLAASQRLTIDGDLERSHISSDLPMTIDRRDGDFHGTLNGGGPALHVNADRSEVRFRAR